MAACPYWPCSSVGVALQHLNTRLFDPAGVDIDFDVVLKWPLHRLGIPLKMHEESLLSPATSSSSWNVNVIDCAQLSATPSSPAIRLKCIERAQTTFWVSPVGIQFPGRVSEWNYFWQDCYSCRNNSRGHAISCRFLRVSVWVWWEFVAFRQEFRGFRFEMLKVESWDNLILMYY